MTTKTTNKILEQLTAKVSETTLFIREKLRPRNDVNQKLLDEYDEVLREFGKADAGYFLEGLRKVMYRTTPEGIEANYTEGTSLEHKGEHKTLIEYLQEIEDLASRVR